ncbi:MAG: hypothetical protein GY950_18490 [bacterium]|nr:hypothetical protein [bacterium]
MKKRNLIYDIGIVVLLIVVVAVVYVKFFAAKPQSPVDIKGIDTLTVLDTSGTAVKFSGLMENGRSAYVFIFYMDDCYSCIHRGIQDLVQLQKDGKNCVGLVVHELINEVEGWSAKQEFSPFFMIKKTDFYEHVNTSMTPVIMKIVDGKVESSRYITP